MMKGISQSKRNHAWHTKHTQKMALFRERRKMRLFLKTRVVKIKASDLIRKDTGLWARFKMWLKKIFIGAQSDFTNVTATNAHA